MTGRVRGERATDVDQLIEPYVVRPSHDDLLEQPSVGLSVPPVDCSAVIVPSHDRPHRLWFAADLASRLQCPLVVLSTVGYESEVRRAISSRPRPPRWWNVSLPHARHLSGASGRTTLALPGLESEWEAGAAADKYRDVATKRNIGLALSVLLGWSHTLMLDDDVRGLTAAAVRTACGWVVSGRSQSVASWRSTRFPDNSAVCHAGRVAGLDQGVFVGSGAMVLRVHRGLPVFPPVYNEDWLFLFDELGERRVIDAGEVRQLVYDPFDPRHRRGAQEEFGDLLGEGLYHLLHHALPLEIAARPEYWVDVVAERQLAIRRIRQALGPVVSRQSGARVMRNAAACLASAREQHRRELPEELASFVRAWRRDVVAWRSWLAGLPSVDGIGEALHLLGVAAEQ